MKIAAAKASTAIAPIHATGTPSTRTYESVSQQIERAMKSSVTQEVEQILKSPNPAPKDLLRAQVKISEFHLKVEFLSRAAESALATIRKFQQGQ